MTRVRGMARKPMAPAVARDHPIVAKILEGVEAMTRNRLKNLRTHTSKSKAAPSLVRRGQGSAARIAPEPASNHRRGTRVSSRKKCHISSLPLEIVLEIGRHLVPGDLLSLSITCNRFNAMLTSRKVQFVWKIAFENAVEKEEFWVGPAPQPRHLNEMQYADFVFGKECMACRSTTVGCQTFWSLGVRLCRLCRKENLIETKELVKYIQSRDGRLSEYMTKLLVNCIPLADDYYRSPGQLTHEGVMTGLRLRDEAMFILSTLLDSKKVCKAKGEFEGCISAIAAHTYLRVYTAKVTAQAFSIDSIKYTNPMLDPRRIHYQPSQRVALVPP